VLGGREVGIDAAQAFDHGSLQKTLSPWSVADLVRATGLPRSTIRDLQSERTARPHPSILLALRKGLSCLVEENQAHARRRIQQVHLEFDGQQTRRM
jgi:hypothetical protein